MQRPTQRVGVFIDVQNMYHSARALYQQLVDFGAILEEAVGNRQLVRALAYVIENPDDASQKDFFTALEDRGYELRSKVLQNFSSGASKGDWDVGIVIDMIEMAHKLDVIVLVSGDGDFTPAVEHLRHLGCRVEVMAFSGSASQLLRSAADAVFDLSHQAKRFLIKSKTRSTAGQRTSTDRPRRRPARRA